MYHSRHVKVNSLSRCIIERIAIYRVFREQYKKTNRIERDTRNLYL